MADHPAIVALAKVIWRHDGASDKGQWENLSPETQMLYEMQARAAYAFVLKDLMEPSEAMLAEAPRFVDGLIEMLRARAREIGVEMKL